MAVIDRPLPSYEFDATCALAQDPIAPGPGGLVDYYDSTSLGTNVLVLHGSNGAAGSALAAYDARNCAFLGRVDLPLDSVGGPNWAIVPLAGWSSATPFTNVEHWRLVQTTDDGGSYVFELSRSDDAGELVDTYRLEPSAADGYFVHKLVYDAVGDRFFASMDPGLGVANVSLLTFDRPAPGAQQSMPLAVMLARLAHPCANSPELAGADGTGNVVFGQRQPTGPEYRVCWATATAEFALPPITWRPDVDIDTASIHHAMVTPSGAYLLHRTDVDGGLSPYQIERAVLTPP